MTFDLLIKGGRIIDGSGNPWYWGDVGIADGRIAAIGRLSDATAAATVDVAGQVVAPGFIDIHSHADFIFPLPNHLRILAPFVKQGITTLVVGNCGLSPAPVNRARLDLLESYTAFMQADPLDWEWTSFGQYLDLLDRRGVALNVVPLVSHGALRIHVMGFEARPATESELAEMRRLCRQALEENAFGLSAGLIYAPGMYASTDELIAVAEPLREFDGLFTCHVRGSSETLLSATKELLRIGAATGARVQHSHIEAFGRDHWPKIERVLALHDAARAQGIDAGFDVIPYTAANTTLTAILPPWVFEGGIDMVVERLSSPKTRAAIEADVEDAMPGWPAWLPGAWPHNLVGATGWDNIAIIWVQSERNKWVEGKTLTQIAAERGQKPFDVAANLIIEERGQAMGLYIGVSGDFQTEDGLRTFLAHPRGSINTDAILTGRGLPHPAAYGAFPRVLGQYVRDQRLITLEDAVRRMTSLTAQRCRLKRRGLLREGYAADITVFDPATVADRATYLNPCQFPAGITQVVVNGHIIVENGELRDAGRFGQVLRHN